MLKNGTIKSTRNVDSIKPPVIECCQTYQSFAVRRLTAYFIFFYLVS